MTDTLIQHLAAFTAATSYEDLPVEVADDSKRVLLDSIGCALAAVDEPRGRIGIEYAGLQGGTDESATILGSDKRSSVFGAGFANGELINTLDFDAALPPGHVAPYVIPGALAVAEERGASGKELIAAVALAHEITHRFGKSMDYLRDTKDGKTALPTVVGFSSTVFGATAAIGRLRGLSAPTLAHGLGIAATSSPVNAHRAWIAHAPSSTAKYHLQAGTLVQTALTASWMAELGHRGDLQVLDDAEVGYRRFIGTSRWAPENLTDGLGTRWDFPAQHSYKLYPHCRILHAPLDALIEIVETHDIRPQEIESIRVWGEGWVMEPVWLSREVEHVHDAQFSIAHGIAVGAHRITPGRGWQDPDLVFGSSVRTLMDKVTYEPHPDYVTALESNPAARPTRVEVTARGTTHTAERSFPKGSPSPDPATYATTDDLVDKFRHNASGVLSEADTDHAVETLLNLETAADVRAVLRALTPSRSRR
ncbi:MmgE/PrpD family protein [Streptomyces sp. NWU49]|uniref:MmgE/PrpD family protein n=1 Tax=Streptomyces sp. NWU49 TaxID=2201153 RepID=UPI000D672110|nr:MmgE/PrpD family protein [Streptomyces sp. NWU49]PWJ02450.1 MmgE/PrpD family protein [Streptomyces sp. NWU49]